MIRYLIKLCAVLYVLQFTHFILGNRLYSIIAVLPIVMYGIYTSKNFRIYSFLLFPLLFIFDSSSWNDYFFTISKVFVCIIALYAGIVMRHYWKFLGLVMVIGIASDLFYRLYASEFDILYVMLGPNSYKIVEDSVFTDTNFYGLILFFVLVKFYHEKVSIPLKILVIVCILLTASKAAWLVLILLAFNYKPLITLTILLLSIPVGYDYLIHDSSGATKIEFLKEFIRQDFISLGEGYEKGIYFNGHYRHQLLPILLGVGGLAHTILFLVYISLEMRLLIIIGLGILGLSYVPIYNEYIWFAMGLLAIRNNNEVNNILRKSRSFLVSFSG